MWHRSIMDTVFKGKERGMCLYGAGYWGEIAYKIFVKLGCEPICFCDDDETKQGADVCGIPVYSLEEAVRRYPGAVYIVCIDGRKKQGRIPQGRTDMYRKLEKHHVYDSHCELRIPLYVFLIEMSEISDENTEENLNDLIMADDVQNLIIYNHMGSSGSWYLEQLLDGHPNVLTLHNFIHTILMAYERRLQDLEGDELLIEMAAQLTNYFHSHYTDTNRSDGGLGIHGAARGADGEFLYDVLIHADDFMKYLRLQFKGRAIRLDSLGHMLKIYAAAYADCLGKRKKCTTQKYWFLWNMHRLAWNVEDTYRYFQEDEFERLENLFIIRDPVQQLHSWLRMTLERGRLNQWVKGEAVFPTILECELGRILEKKPGIENVKAIRFEDLKLRKRETLQSLLDWMDVPYDDCLSETTVNGIQVYYASSGTGKKAKYITGNDTSAVERKDFSDYFTLWDEVRLNMVYSKFKSAYGYQNDVPDFTEFGSKIRRKIFEQGNFKFADIFQKFALEQGDIEPSFSINKYVVDHYLEFMEKYREDTEYYECIRP